MKKYIYIIFMLAILLMSWEFNKEDVALASSNNIIPEEAIRLRIIANSDSATDQWLKREIRDIVTEEIDKWVDSLDNINDARHIINNNIPQIEEMVNQTIEKYGYDYDAQVELGIVPFPTKMYGEIVYPAGNYEALRITLGEGQGENWWCVLFPPLCFVDMSTADAISSTEENEKIETKFFVVELFQKWF